MLSDRERQRSGEVEQGLLAEDPEFARSFDDLGQRASRRGVYAIPRWAYTIAVVVAVVFGGLMLVVGAVGIALVFATPATMILWVARRRTARRAPRSDPT